MKHIVDAVKMKEIDEYTINEMKLPSLVLMERAAVCVAEVIEERFDKNTRVIIVSGCGNNGADGVAVARILSDKGFDVSVYLVDNTKRTTELDAQITIAQNWGVTFIDKWDATEYDVIVDGIFGIGLSKKVSGEYERVINMINKSDCKVVSIDIPSGINSSDGKVENVAVKADITVTFGFKKIGQILYPGAGYAGELIVKDPGFYTKGIEDKSIYFTMDKKDIKSLPERSQDSHKGTFGKVLVIAGSKECQGAAVLCAKSALKSGSGMVKVLTHQNNRNVLACALPEALIATYDECIDVTFCEELLEWADSVVIGPGIGVDTLSKELMNIIMDNKDKPIIIDADAINIIAGEKKLLNKVSEKCIFTPHLLEMSRLSGKSVTDIKNRLIDTATEFAENYGCICVLKDSRTIVAKSSQRVYINSVGNSGMATAGSGDVLSGIIGSLAGRGIDTFDAAAYGVLVHGLSGDCAAECIGQTSMIAGDIIDNIHKVFEC